MNSSSSSAIAAQVALEVATRTSKTAWDWLNARTRGFTLLLIGPSGSGKTTFFEYLQCGVLSPEAPPITTVEAETSTPLSLSIGPDERLKLHIRRFWDTPGQLGPMAHANLINEVRPHAVLLILDSTARVVDLKDWVLDFCVHVERVFHDSPASKENLRAFVCVLNKTDKQKGAQYFRSRSQAVRAYLAKGLARTFGPRAKAIPILQCVSVMTEHHNSRLIDAVIAKLAMQVKKDGK